MNEPQVKNSAKLRAIAPQFVVPDVIKTAEYYRDVLGFKILGYFLDPPVYAIVGRDNVEIHLGKGDTNIAQGNVTRRSGGLDAYIFVKGVDDLFEEFRQRQVDIVEGPIDQIYGQREIMIRDCNGFTIGFGDDSSNVAT